MHAIKEDFEEFDGLQVKTGDQRNGPNHNPEEELLPPSACTKQRKTSSAFHQYSVAIAGSLPFAAVGAAIAWPSPTLPKILSHEAPVSLDTNEISWMVSLLYIGNLLSPIPSGYLADGYGRKKTLIVSGILPIVSWILIIFSENATTLYVARFIGGLHFGLVATVQPIYIGEISQPDIRGTLSTLNNFSFNAGNLFVFVIGPFVSYKTLAMVALILPVLFIVTFCFMPESPYYSVMRGNIIQARENLSWLRRDLNKEEVEIELNRIGKGAQQKKVGSFRDLVSSRASRKALTISVVLSAVKKLSGNGVIEAFATLTLPTITFGVLKPKDCVIILGIVTVLSSLLASCIADKFGRKKLLIVSCMGCSLSMFAVAIWFFLSSKLQVDLIKTSFIPFVGCLVQNVSYNVAIGPSGGLVKGEFFPPHVKTKCSAVATITVAVVSFVTNKFYLMVAEMEGMYMNYFVFAVSCFLAVFFIAYYVPETRGKTLEEIQDLLGRDRKKKTACAVQLVQQDIR